MRVLVLGGGGAMGAVAARVTASLPTVRTVVVADRDLGAARRAAAGAGERAEAVRVDITDGAALAALLDGVDAVLNTVGPFTRFGPTVLDAAIRGRTHYLDICDDPGPTREMLIRDDRARAAGVTAIVGMGASPGTSNLLAALAVARLDEVHDLHTAWPVDVGADGGDGATVRGPDGRPSAAAVHWMEQISGVVPVVVAGALTEQAPLRPVELRLPGGRAGTAYVVGHPEPLTLHATYAPKGNAACLMVVTSGTVAFLDGLRNDIDAGRLDHEQAADELGSPSARRKVGAGIRSVLFGGPGTLPPFFASATGRRAGQQLTVLATLDGRLGDMAEATGVPLAMGLAQVLDGTACHPGVRPPERIIDAQRLLADLDRRAVVSEMPAGQPG